MWIFIVAIVVIGTVAAGASILWDKSDNIEIGKDCTSCTGFDLSCEQNCMMEAATKPVEYFDDEELDRFKGKDSNEYTDEEADEFSEVLYTMRPEEVKGWNRSLILRGINVPNQIKDELITMIEG